MPATVLEPRVLPRTQREAVADLARVAGVTPVSVGHVPAIALWAMALFNPMMRELPEVAYQLEAPFIMDSSPAQHTFGLDPTPLGRRTHGNRRLLPLETRCSLAHAQRPRGARPVAAG